MTLSVAIPTALVDVSNGTLEKKTDLGDGYTRWDWRVHYPINNYGVALNIASYVHFADRVGNLPVDYYVLPENLEKAKQQFAQTVPMLEAFRRFVGDYPFERDGFKLVEVPYAGMEHQSAVAYGNRFANGYLERDWTGSGSARSSTSSSCTRARTSGSATPYPRPMCRTCGFTKGGRPTRDALRRAPLWRRRRPPLRQRLQDQGAEPGAIITQRGIHRQPNQDMYFKGALFLHTLRGVVDDDARWFALVRDVFREFRYRNILTEDLVRFMSARLGRNLTPIFDEYLRRTELPTLELAFQAEGTMAYRWKAVGTRFRDARQGGHRRPLADDRADHRLEDDAGARHPRGGGRGNGSLLRERQQAVADGPANRTHVQHSRDPAEAGHYIRKPSGRRARGPDSRLPPSGGITLVVSPVIVRSTATVSSATSRARSTACSGVRPALFFTVKSAPFWCMNVMILGDPRLVSPRCAPRCRRCPRGVDVHA
jgi:hypothetical protein